MKQYRLCFRQEKLFLQSREIQHAYTFFSEVSRKPSSSGQAQSGGGGAAAATAVGGVNSVSPAAAAFATVNNVPEALNAAAAMIDDKNKDHISTTTNANGRILYHNLALLDLVIHSFKSNKCCGIYKTLSFWLIWGFSSEIKPR